MKTPLMLGFIDYFHGWHNLTVDNSAS